MSYYFSSETVWFISFHGGGSGGAAVEMWWNLLIPTEPFASGSAVKALSPPTAGFGKDHLASGLFNVTQLFQLT